MILTRSPLRISLGGGGTDLSSYYKEHEGFLIAAAIDKYVYVSVIERFIKKILLKYSSLELCDSVDEVKHPIIREAMKLIGLKDLGIEVVTMADIPAGTGLGSSGSFTTALVLALNAFNNRSIGSDKTAELSCCIEIEKLNEPIGKQDQYIAAYGGITCFTFHKDDSVSVEPLGLSREVLFNLEDNLLLFFTGFSRSAGSILKDQNSRSQSREAEMTENLHFIKELGLRSKSALQAGKIKEFGMLMDEHWEYKRKRSPGMSNKMIDEWYELGKKNGAIGGKLVGAGGGGFLMFLANDPNKLRETMAFAGLEEVRFGFDFEGTKTVVSS